MARITVDDCINMFPNRFELTLAVKHSSITSRVKNPDIYMGINDAVRKVERQLEK